MNPMIERVANEIEMDLRRFMEHEGQFHIGERNGDRVFVDGTIDLVALARAAIAALREPTKEMIAMGNDTADECICLEHDTFENASVRVDTKLARDTFVAMIDQALKEE